MSKTVDERVVEMRFDNKQFESNVQTSMSTIEKLKQSLNLTGASKGLENVSAAAKKCDMSGLSGAVETVHLKFSALEVMALRVLNNIADSAYNTGKRVVSALTIDPVKTGFQEYETQINAIQTILANTESKGSTLQDVNAALDELNHYADMTIYNFTEMTRNIGTFTAAGVDLDTSVSAIKGIANLAAVSGSTSQQASTAMYQLSQALASGTVKLMDWNSVVNAGMGGQVFQDALKETARVHNIAIDDMIKEEGSFRETLSKGWLTSEILTETLSKFTGDLTESQLQQMGYTEEQVKSILKMGQTANDAATKVKTLTQLYDTLKEAAQSGWTKTWELIVGDFDHAKELYTSISDTVSGYLNAVSDKRNALLQDALYNNYQKLTSEINKAGIETNTFEEAAKKALSSHGYDVDILINKYGSLENVFTSGRVSANVLREVVNGLKSELVDLSEVTAGLSKGSTGDDVKKIQEALNELGFDVGEHGIDGIIGSDTDAAIKAFQAAQGLDQTGIIDDATLAALKEASSNTVEFSDSINDLIDNITELGGREKIIESFKNIFKFLGDVIKPVKEAFREIFPATTSEQLGSAIDKFKEFTEGLKVGEETADKIKRTFTGLFSIFDMFGRAISAVLSPIGEFIGSGGLDGLASAFLSATATVGDFFTALNNGDFDNVSEAVSKALQKISDAGGAVHDSLEKVVGIISENVDIKDWIVGGSIVLSVNRLAEAIANVKSELSDIFDNSDKTSLKDKFIEALDDMHDALTSFVKGVNTASLVGIAIAVLALSYAMERISKMKSGQIVSSLGAIGGGLTELCIALYAVMKILKMVGSDNKGAGKLRGGTGRLLGAIISLSILAGTAKKLAKAMAEMAKLDWEDISKGFVGMGLAFTDLIAALMILEKYTSLGTVFKSLGVTVITKNLDEIADYFETISNRSWEDIAKGFVSMGAAFTDIIAALTILEKYTSLGTVFKSLGVTVITKNLDEIADYFETISNRSWEDIAKGFVSMGAAFTDLVAAIMILDNYTSLGSILKGIGINGLAGSLNEIADYYEAISNRSWDDISKGFVSMGLAFTDLVAAVGVLDAFVGIGAIFGGIGLYAISAGLGDIADAFVKFGDMNWTQIGHGVTSMTAALGSAGLGGVLNTFSAVGFGSLALGVSSLNDLADAFVKFGEMSWGEIDRGITAMWDALGASGLGGLLNTLSFVGAFSIKIIAKPIGDLADSVKKWEDVTVLDGLGTKLGELGDGIKSFFFTSWAADDAKIMPEVLSDLSDAIDEWGETTIPENLGSDLKDLAKGVKAFRFSGWGAENIGTSADSLADLADAVKAWTDLTISESLINEDTGLAPLAESVSAWNWVDPTAIGDVLDPLKTFGESLQEWTGVTLSVSQSDLEGLAGGVAAFNDISTDNIESVCTRIEELGTAVTNLGTVDFSAATSAVSNFAFAIQNVQISTDSFKNIGTTAVNNFTSALGGSSENLSAAGGSMVNSIASGVTLASNGLSLAVSSVIETAITNADEQVKTFESIGSTIADKLQSGISAKPDAVANAAASITSSGETSVRDYHDNFYQAAAYLVAGFISGINDNINTAAQTAAKMAKAASDAAKKELKERSPSRIFYKIGAYAGQGFVNALSDYRDVSYSAGASIAQSAKDGIDKAIVKVIDSFGNSMDSGLTIRPVLDLSAVESGITQMNSMFGTQQTIGVESNIGAISSMMSERQSGNDDVVYAINKLGKGLNNLDRPSYNINGVTYDNGSEIAEAVGAIVRAAQIERRR
jgi:tape measure domain-containing protein